MNASTPWWGTVLIAVIVPIIVTVLTQARTDKRERLKVEHERQLRYLDRVLDTYSRALLPLEQARQVLKRTDPDWGEARVKLREIWEPFQMVHAIAADDRVIATTALMAMRAGDLARELEEIEESESKSANVKGLLEEFESQAYRTRKILREDMMSLGS